MKLTFGDAILKTDPLVDRAIARLREKIRDNAADGKSLRSLGDLLRQKGELQEARHCYQELKHYLPEDQDARYLAQVLEMGATYSTPTPPQTCSRFYRTGNFLNQDEQATVWNCLYSNTDKLTFGRLDGDIKNRAIRASSTLSGNSIDDIANWFLDKVTSELEKAWCNLSDSTPDIGKKEIQLTYHNDGEFYKLHQDSDEGDTRYITYVYYFFQEPKPFRGGDLILLDDMTSRKTVNSYTRFAPINNSIIFFPSAAYHQVTPVSTDKPGLEGGRFSLNGWLHAQS